MPPRPMGQGYKLSAYSGPVEIDRIDAFIELVEASEEIITVIAVGPTPSLAEATKRNLEIAQKCDFYGMFGSFFVGYDGAEEIAAEYNVANKVEAFRTLIGAEWNSATLTPLDTCGTFYLSGDNYNEI